MGDLGLTSDFAFLIGLMVICEKLYLLNISFHISALCNNPLWNAKSDVYPTFTETYPSYTSYSPHVHSTFTLNLQRPSHFHFIFTSHSTNNHPTFILPSSHINLTFTIFCILNPKFTFFRFGDCFGRNTRTSKAPWGTNGEISHHKFYLAFENSIHCNDYISEKFWRNALSSGAVPVVYGQDLKFSFKTHSDNPCFWTRRERPVTIRWHSTRV